MNTSKTLELLNKNKHKLHKISFFEYQNNSIIEIERKADISENTLFEDDGSSLDTILMIIFPSISILNFRRLDSEICETFWNPNFENDRFIELEWKFLYPETEIKRQSIQFLRSLKNVFQALEKCDVVLMDDGTYCNYFEGLR